jgi:uracil-DNA glycosylase
VHRRRADGQQKRLPSLVGKAKQSLYGVVKVPVVPLSVVHHRIVACEHCPRLRFYCEGVAREKRKAYRDDTYWAKPVPGFGDPRARLLIIGLAPAAHGANRTGRVFTGDGVGGSSDFLMSALHRAGFANRPTSQQRDDGLSLRDAYITMAVRCAPPGNKPTPLEISNCLPHLEAELAALARVRVVIALGKIGFDAYVQYLKRADRFRRARPHFVHGLEHRLPDGLTLIGCYHPSRQNTHTGKLTSGMMDAIFRRARRLIAEPG